MERRVEIKEIIERELLNWPGVIAGQHRFGGREFRVGKLELGHLHGSAVADLPFPRAIRDELVSRGKVAPHHHVPNSGWVSFYFLARKIFPRRLRSFAATTNGFCNESAQNTSLKESSQAKHESNH